MKNIDYASMKASIAIYLEELRESGVEGLPKEIESKPELDIPSFFHSSLMEQSNKTSDPSSHRYESLHSIRKNLGDCHRCKLGKSRKNLVFGCGNSNSRIMFIGEAPENADDLSGEPFMGDVGVILNRIITAMGLSREEVYLCNVIKCHTPGDRTPEIDEIASCSPFLFRQIASVVPEVIVTLGSFATQTLLGIKEPISKVRGKFHDYKGIPLMPTFHPSYLLHNSGNKELFWNVWEDVIQVLQLLGLPVPDKNRK